jgi:predicted RNase H-like HicB family nuclease
MAHGIVWCSAATVDRWSNLRTDVPSEGSPTAKRRYAIVIEAAGSNILGYVPDLPICVATGDTPDEVEDLLRESIDLYLESLRD